MISVRVASIAAALATAGSIMRTADAAAQDTTTRAVEGGVRIGVTYKPGTRPGILVLGGDRDIRLDSARAIIRRDLEYSDRFG
jgi:hypothetical protein